MGKIIGNKKVNPKTFTEEEIIELTAELNQKIVELTAENVKVKDEFDAKDETINELNQKIVELTAEKDALEKKVEELTTNESEGGNEQNVTDSENGKDTDSKKGKNK